MQGLTGSRLLEGQWICASYALNSYPTVHAFPGHQGSPESPVFCNGLAENIPSAVVSPLCAESHEHCNSHHTRRK